jgi:hypothetical protein
MPNNNNEQQSWWNSGAGQAVAGAGGQILGMLGGIGQANRQYHRQKRLMGFQQQNQMALNQQGHDLQMDMWNKTNYGAQVKHMLEAGLNPALMYGSAGQGGTTGSQGGGSAAGGSAAGENVMDLQNALLGKQLEKIDSEIGVNETKAALNEIEHLLSTNDYDWLTNNNISRQSSTLIKTIAEISGDSYPEVLKLIDRRLGEILRAEKGVSDTVNSGYGGSSERARRGAEYGTKAREVIKNKGGATKTATEEAVKSILKGIQKGFDNNKEKNEY